MSLIVVRLSLTVILILSIMLPSTAEEETPEENGDSSLPMSSQERENLKEEARDMFYHAYRAYMDNAYPADELMPLSCRGRYRGVEPSRGDIDDVLGNFSVTLIDTLDTLVILGDLSEFEHAVKLIIKDVTFDTDVIVSVFETNIRVLGGLLSGHILAEYVEQTVGIMKWYRGELLMLAKDLGYRMLPAFNTTTGIPRARINLKKGINKEGSQETCTACAGTMVLEMAALSRLTGDPVFEEKAHTAMSSLWRMRHRGSDLMGTVLNVHSGDWVRRDSGVGAGIDSYYEYCLKAYVLLGDNRYLNRFNKHYSAVMKYISQGPMLVDVHMHRPHTNSRNFMDALLAFWPGLQVLSGDLKPAVETHEMLYQVMQRHNFIPEAFTTDFQVHWGQYPLRPEFLESTYFLYKATSDPYYLNVGKKVLRALQKHARVPCGYAAVSDVRTGHHDDRMDSFVLAETFKYLFLLFAEPSELLVDLDKFIFTTEAHLLPLTLASKPSNASFLGEDEVSTGSEDPPQCPSTLRLFPHAVRKPLKNLVHQTCPRTQHHRRLTASTFQSGNPDHKRIIRDMGITIAQMDDGRIQLLHTFSKAKSLLDAEEGLLFMQEMIELAKSQGTDTLPQAVSYYNEGVLYVLSAGPAHFGKQLTNGEKVVGNVGVADPLRACSEITNADSLKGKIAIVQRGDCMFIDKARRVLAAGAIGGIVVDNQVSSDGTSPHMFAMSGDGKDDVTIPFVFLFSKEAWELLNTLIKDSSTVVTLSETSGELKKTATLDQQSSLDKFKDSVHDFLFSQNKEEITGKGDVQELDAEKIEEVLELARKEAYMNSEGIPVIPPQRLHDLLLIMTKKTKEQAFIDALNVFHKRSKDEL